MEPQENKNEKAPILKTRINKSKSGKWMILTTEITTILPTNYIKAIVGKGESS